MKAVVIEKFGGPEQLLLKEVPTPIPAENEIQIEVSHASVNPVDWKIREGYLKDMLPHAFPIVLGWDAAGRVSAVGSAVTSLKVGDRVYAYCRKPTVQWGTYAEYVCIDAQHAAVIPDKLSFGEAATIPLTALTAWQALFDVAKLKSDESVLILAGAGGVGGMAIQLAKQAGAKVLTTASFKNHGYVKELGADTPIDYSEKNVSVEVKQLFPTGVDVVFDCAGGDSLKEAYALVKKGGRLVSIVDTPDEVLSARLGIKSHYHFVAPNGGQLKQIAEKLAAGQLLVPSIEEMKLEDAAAAHLRSQTHHQRGKIALRVR